VLSAADGTSAVELSRQTGGRIDLLLSDMIMPGLNGRQVAHQITEQRPGIRVLFMSGHADGVLGRNGLIEEEHTQLIRKPFTPTELAQRVDEVLSAALPR
jgi:CheY-like chemotaxis protein